VDVVYFGSYSGLTDDGFAQIMQHIKTLDCFDLLILDNTEVTDAGIAQLKGMTGLKNLMVSGTHVTQTGVAELNRALPKLSIRRG
jgi:hypothetical protein